MRVEVKGRRALSFEEVVWELEHRDVMPKKIPTLEWMVQGLEAVSLTHEEIASCVGHDLSRIILVAGTNGKGSVAATLAQLLQSAGQRVGFYSSPHLESYCERIRIQGETIDPDLFAHIYSTIVERTSELPLTHFEILTLMAAWYFFRQEHVDYAVFEVGMGGTWDATNALPHTTAIITSLGFDHEAFLGSTLVEIATNKFGIIPHRSDTNRGGAKVISGKLPEELLSLQRNLIAQRECMWEEIPPDSFSVDHDSSGEPIFILHSTYGTAPLALKGPRAVENTSIALGAFKALGFDPSSHLHALFDVKWPGRMEPLYLGQRKIYLSGDHNPSGVESLCKLLEYFSYQTLHLIVGVGKRKNLNGILAPLFALPDVKIHLTVSPFEGRTLDEYGDWRELAAHCDPSPEKLLEDVVDFSNTKDLIIVTGSLYLVGALRHYLKSRSSSPSGSASKWSNSPP